RSCPRCTRLLKSAYSLAITPDTWLPICTVVTADSVPVAVTVMVMFPRSTFSVLYCSPVLPRLKQAADRITHEARTRRRTIAEPLFKYVNTCTSLKQPSLSRFARRASRFAVLLRRATRDRRCAICYSSRPMALFGKDAPPPPRPQPSRPDDPQSPFEGTFFGPNTVIDGSLTGSEPVLIEGTVKGTIRLTGELRIGTKARIESKVHAKS